MIPNGRVGEVYRATHGRDRNGDPIDADGNVIRLEADGTNHIGTVKGIVMGGMSAQPSASRQESFDTSGQCGIPYGNTIVVQFGDRILIDGIKYKVGSTPQWAYPNSMSTTKPKNRWYNLEGTGG